MSAGSREPLSVVLETRIRTSDIRHLQDGTFLVYTDAEPSDIRDWLAGKVDEVFVVEFERWSSRGSAADRRWLLRRGH